MSAVRTYPLQFYRQIRPHALVFSSTQRGHAIYVSLPSSSWKVQYLNKPCAGSPHSCSCNKILVMNGAGGEKESWNTVPKLMVCLGAGSCIHLCDLEVYFEYYFQALPGAFSSVSEVPGQSYKACARYLHINAAKFPSSTYRKYPNSRAHLPIHYT